MTYGSSFFLEKMKIENFFRKNKIELNNKKLIVASSAGPDSMALLSMLEKIRQGENFVLIAAHFDHQLRPDSSKETELLAEFCQKNKIKLVNKKWQRKTAIESGLEAAARDARYRFLTETVKKENGDYLLTAHHGDDLIENILLKFIRSGNPNEMNSLQEKGQMNGVKLLRPLLGFEKQQLLDYDKENKIPFIVDSTNQEDFALRNRLRHHVVPLLKKENPHLVKNALRYSHQMTQINQLLQEEFADIKTEKILGVAYRVKVEDLDSFTAQERKQFWQNLIWQKYHRRVNENLGNFQLEKYKDYFYLSSKNIGSSLKKHTVKPEETFYFNKRYILLTMQPKRGYTLVGDFWAESRNFEVGSLIPGAKLLLQNGQHVKSKKKFAEAMIPNFLRQFCLTVYQDNEPVFVEKTYQSQIKSAKLTHYFLYQLKNA